MSDEQTAQLREELIALMLAVNPPSELLNSEVEQFRKTGIAPERWRSD